MDPVTKCLECPYHGWQFDGVGACKAIPQLDKGQAIPKAASKPNLETRVTGDVLWSANLRILPKITTPTPHTNI